MTANSFSSLGLRQELLGNLETLDYQSMTPIQAETLPLILDGLDVIGQGKTGSGKTAAFALGLLQKLDVKQYQTQSLVLCPTRELADQVAKEIRKLARAIPNIKVLTLCGGMSMGHQISSLQHGAHILVGTPGRVMDHLRKRTLTLNHLNTLVLDEADRMLDMGFEESLNKIVRQLPKNRQTLLFSATYPESIQSMAERVMHKPEMVQVASTHDESSIQEYFYKVRDREQRMIAVRLILQKFRPQSSVVFCNTKRETQELAEELAEHGFSAVALHGDLEQKERSQILVRFANRSASVLVATDVASRGLDIESVDAVINFQLAYDPEVHVHRIGRTGRAGSSGTAHSLYGDRDGQKLVLLEDYLGRTIQNSALPSQNLLNRPSLCPPMATLRIDGVKKQKIRAGDILGALTGEDGITGKEVGKIDLFEYCAYVAVKRDVVKPALKKLSSGKIKGRTFRVRQIRR
ncbi:ATP-dependent RNA helicase DbpA [Dongshaea marina]|uniref:ATP-dependent RNA helicase DbpA n=1 Tax=Dongshaea marina TaxID=2047966 RepID=UPI000D3E6B82|nr:ATP-dependent RNA helicase DbpA [Dongshaea marina]